MCTSSLGFLERGGSKASKKYNRNDNSHVGSPVVRVRNQV